jgi:hypothetical protein
VSRRPYYRSRDAGIEFAREHIRQARELSRELGGTDEDVKEYFFGLSGKELRRVLDQYERDNGRGAREYAEATIPAWKSGAVKMSGQNASRLFKLLPQFMPLEAKYALVESLWGKMGPRSECSVAFGPGANERQVTELVRQHVTATVSGHSIPEALQNRFRWLADGDVRVMEQLLNHFLTRDREQAIMAVSAQVALLLPHARNSAVLQAFRRELKIGGHTVHVFLDPRESAVRISPGSPAFKPPLHEVWGWILGVIAGFVALFLFLSRK